MPELRTATPGLGCKLQDPGRGIDARPGGLRPEASAFRGAEYSYIADQPDGGARRRLANYPDPD